MATTDVTTEAPVRCSPWTRGEGVDPIGSAGAYRSFMLVEWPLPWPRDMGDVPALGELRSDLAAAGCRLQGLVPRDGGPTRTVAYYQADPGRPFHGYRRSHLAVEPPDVIAAARQLLAGGGAAPDAAAGSEVLVCTHGRRDRCCGSMGTEVALQLLDDPDCLGAGTSVWRTSHTGGHRFAPTALVFPEGTGWAFVDASLLARVAGRQGQITEVLGHYRGCAGLGSPRIQAVERAVLAEVGWDLFDAPRWGSEEPDGTVQFHAELPGGLATWEAVVADGRVLPVPDCGAPLAQAYKTQTELAVGPLRRVR